MKKFLLLLSVLLLLSICGPQVLASNHHMATTFDDGYNDSLLKVGLTYDRYLNMSPETQNIYKEFYISSVETTKAYYKIVQKPETSVQKESIVDVENEEIISISAEQYQFETSLYLRNLDYYHLKRTVGTNSDSDSSSTTWVAITTSLSQGSVDRWVLLTDVTRLNNGSILGSTDIIGLGCNPQFSVVSKSEYLRRSCTLFAPEGGIYVEDVTYYPDVQVKGSMGYASYYDVLNIEIHNEVFFILALKPNNINASVVDGFGHYIRRNTTFKPTINFGIDGSSISVSPSSNLLICPNTHVQLDI